MRIMLVLEAAGGGAGRHVLDLIAGLCERQHSVTLVYSSHRSEAAFESRIGELRDVEIHRLPMRREVGARDLFDAMSLRTLIKRAGPFDIVHAHSSKAGALLRLAQISDSTPCIYTPHALITLNPDIGFLGRHAYSFVERFLARLSSNIICVSEQERINALGLGIAASKLTVVHNGIEVVPAGYRSECRESVRSELGIDEQTVCVGTVGRLSHQKSVDRLLTAFSICDRLTNDNCRLVIVGDGPGRLALEELARQLGLEKHVIFTGHQDGLRLMTAMDIFALSSRYEAFPYVLLEAAMLGLPVVMAETGGAGSIVRNELNGIVVQQQSIERFAAALADLVNRPEKRRAYGDQSLQLVRNFKLDRMVDETVDVYRRHLKINADVG